MSTLLIADSAINRFARVATIEDTSINEFRKASATPAKDLSKAE
jgi:hypothetical protein